MDELGCGEAVVELDQIEVLGADSRLFVRLLRGVAGQGIHVGKDLAGLFVGVAGQDACGDLDRAPLLFP